MPELLALLALQGRIVCDALPTLRGCGDPAPHGEATAQTILDRGGDDVLALEANQPALFEDVRLWLDDPARATVPRPSTATTAGSRPAAPWSATTSPGWPNATISPNPHGAWPRSPR